jgi:adenosylhomocysteine nucleosidase
VQYDIVIFTALDREVSEFARDLERVVVDGSFALWAGSSGRTQVLLVRTGVGPQAAARAADRVFARAHAGAALSIGTCGALSPDLAAGDAVIATEVLDAESGERFPADMGLLDRARTTPQGSRTHRFGRVATVSSVVASPNDKKALADRTGADAVDMESAVLARASRDAGVPFVAVRAVLDLANEGLPIHPDGPLIDDLGRPQWSRLLAVAARDPMLPVGLTRLWRRERAARTAIDSFLRAICQERRRVHRGSP